MILVNNLVIIIKFNFLNLPWSFERPQGLVSFLPLSGGGFLEGEGLILFANLRIEMSDWGERTSDWGERMSNEASDTHLVIEVRDFLNCLPDPNYFFVPGARLGLTSYL